jgi:transposase-like protein
LCCPRCQSQRRRIGRSNAHYKSWRCNDCGKYYSLYTGTVFAKTRQPASTLVLLLRGVAQGETSERLARELGLSSTWILELRHRLMEQLQKSAPREVMSGTTFEVDELYQNAGEKRNPAPSGKRSAQTARQQATRTWHV